MKLLGTTFFLLALACVCARGSVYQGESLGVLPARLTTAELDTPVTFELVLSINPFDVIKKRAVEISEHALDVGESYINIVGWLKVRGFTVVATDPSCARVVLQGTRGQIANAFNSHYARLSDATLSGPAGGLPYRPSYSVLTIEEMIIDSIGPAPGSVNSNPEYAGSLSFQLPGELEATNGQ